MGISIIALFKIYIDKLSFLYTHNIINIHVYSNIALGYQNFEEVRIGHIFYIDKTDFIREWWENADKVTLITRPRRFGKTLNMSMIEFKFKVLDPDEDEVTLEDTIASAHRQMNEKQYEAELITRGFAPQQMRKYGFAFRGKECLIG